MDGTIHKKTYTLEEVDAVVDREDRKYNKLKYFMFSVGCNDCDNQTADEVVEKLKNIVMKVQTKFPQVKVIIGEITPRNDNRDQIVKDANILINRFVKDRQNVYVIRNSNLRDRNFTFHEDIKHIAKECIGKFATNIKHTLRLAYGRKKYIPQQHSPNQHRAQQHNQHHQIQHQQLQHQQLQQILWYLTNQSWHSRNGTNVNGVASGFPHNSHIT